MIYLGDVSQSRDNNLNLLRAIAAFGVLVSHAVPITSGLEPHEPLERLTGHSLGAICVFVFFAISGFLITASFERSSSRTSFLVARSLRLLPGLAVNIVLVAFVLAPIVTTLPLGTYFGLADPYLFTARNIAILPVTFDLPGVFDDQPVPSAVGSIWTLRHEVACYAGVFLAGLLGAWKLRRNAAVTLGLYAIGWVGFAVLDPALPQPFHALHELSLPFAIGAAFYMWQDRLPLSLVGVVGLLLLAALLRSTEGAAYYAALALAISYTTFWLGYVPGGAIRAYNRIGDYSYGIYIYAFPLQGAAVWLFGPQTPLENILYSVPPTLVLSYLSWHLIEAPSMAQKHALLRRLPSKAARRNLDTR